MVIAVPTLQFFYWLILNSLRVKVLMNLRSRLRILEVGYSTGLSGATSRSIRIIAISSMSHFYFSFLYCSSSFKLGLIPNISEETAVTDYQHHERVHVHFPRF